MGLWHFVWVRKHSVAPRFPPLNTGNQHPAQRASQSASPAQRAGQRGPTTGWSIYGLDRNPLFGRVLEPSVGFSEIQEGRVLISTPDDKSTWIGVVSCPVGEENVRRAVLD